MSLFGTYPHSSSTPSFMNEGILGRMALLWNERDAVRNLRKFELEFVKTENTRPSGILPAGAIMVRNIDGYVWTTENDLLDRMLEVKSFEYDNVVEAHKIKIIINTTVGESGRR